MQFSIDRNSPVPAYYQIQLDLSDRIQRGEWNDRKQLPSESTLAEQYAVSRITLRQALAELEKDGIIKKIARLRREDLRKARAVCPQDGFLFDCLDPRGA